MTAAPAAAADESLVSTTTTTWRYLDDNTNPAGTDADQRVWTTTAFDDSAWKSATGTFGAFLGFDPMMGVVLEGDQRLGHRLAGLPGQP